MSLRVAASRKPASSKSSPLAGTADTARLPAAGALTAVGGPDRDGSENGSKDESFFEARPWLDSDSDDDFYSVRGDFTPSRGSTPNHQRQTTFISQGMPVDITKPSLVQKKQRLIELLQAKQHYDDEDDCATDVSSYLEDSAVHAEEHLKPSRKGGKVKKSSKSGCFPRSIWKHSFKMCMDTRKEQVHK